MSRMDNIDRYLAEIDAKLAEEKAAEEAAERKKREAEEAKRKAKEEKEKARNAKKRMQDLKKQEEALENDYQKAVQETGLNDSDKKEKTDKKSKNKKKSSWFKPFITGALVVALALPGGHFLAKGIKKITSSDNNKNIFNVQEYNANNNKENTLTIKFREILAEKGIVRLDKMVNGNVAVTPLVSQITMDEVEDLSSEFMKSITSEGMHDNEELKNLGNNFCKTYLEQIGVSVVELDINDTIEEIKTADEELTTEKFEELVANFAKSYVKNNVSLSTEDLTKFNAIMLIDRLAEENPELVQELFALQSEEEFLNDAGKVIGNTYMYNHGVWESEKSTENFIWISEGISDNDSQKVKMQEIENYVKRMAVAAADNNKEEVNKIAAEFIESLTSPTGSLNSLDDGIEFASQVYIAMINNSIGRNYLEQEYRDYFNVRSSAETNVSNIITVIRGCITEGKTKSRTK